MDSKPNQIGIWPIGKSMNVGDEFTLSVCGVELSGVVTGSVHSSHLRDEASSPIYVCASAETNAPSA